VQIARQPKHSRVNVTIFVAALVRQLQGCFVPFEHHMVLGTHFEEVAQPIS
jgi:hypothetical protein